MLQQELHIVSNHCALKGNVKTRAIKQKFLMCLVNMQDLTKALVSSDVMTYLFFYASGQILFYIHCY
jgi:hypothetical protein